MVSTDDIQSEFINLHKLVYQVYRQPMTSEGLHQQLAQVFYGELLTAEYIEHFTTQHHMQIEETAIDIRQIDYNQFEVLDSDYGWVTLDVDWSVGGIVTHQGHKHTRINRYRAVYNLNNIEKMGWRITDVKMRNAERIRRASDSELLDGTDAGGGYLDALDLLDAGMGIGDQSIDALKQQEPILENTDGDTGIESVRTMKFEGLE